MATVNGTNSRRASNYDFYFVYSVTNDNGNKRHIVNVKAYIKCASWDFETAVSDPWVHIRIGATTYNRPSAGINCNQYAIPHTYLLWEKTVYIDYSSAEASLYLRAYTDDLNVSGNGPGVCNAATTIKIPAQYSTTGTLAAVANSESDITMKLSGLPSNVGYTRTLKWYYKKSSDSAYTLAYTTTIGATSTTTSFNKNVSELLPGTAYSTKVMIYDDDNLIATKSDAVTTGAFAGNFIVKQMSTTVAYLMAFNMKINTGYTRFLKLYYKKSSESAYVLAVTNSITDGRTISNFGVIRLSPSTKYDFQLKVYAGTVLIATKTVLQAQTDAVTPLPMAVISECINPAGTTKVQVSWDCLDYPSGAYFKVCYQKSGGPLVEGISLSAPPASYSEIDVGAITDDTDFTITVKGFVTNEIGFTTSSPFTVSVLKAFAWDSAKVQGQPCIMTASEWNRLLTFTKEKNPTFFTDEVVAALTATVGERLDNSLFNVMQEGLGITGNDENDADPVTAAELNALVTAVNA